ncbi:hypothetical protein [Mesorhizobium sp. KR1-2]
MAKGQLRGNREIRKPKKTKAPAKVETPFGSQIRLADNGKAGQRPPKK